jgi:hypothetical protein
MRRTNLLQSLLLTASQAVFKPRHLAAACGLFAMMGSAVSTSTAAPVSYTGGILTENFDSIGSTGTTPPTGWSVQLGGGNLVPAGPQAAYTPGGTITVGDGSAAPAGTIDGYNYGLTGDANRSIGTAATGNSKIVDVAIVNNSGSPIAAFKVGYTGRKWRQGSSSTEVDRYDLYYSDTGAANTWLPFPAGFTYNSPNTLPISTARDGLVAPNFTVIAPQNFAPGTPIPDGNTFYIRFWDHNPGGTDGGIAVDDFSFEPDVIVPVAITQQPVGVTVAEGGSATFSVIASGSAPTYQWFENGSAIVGSNGPTLVINPALRDRDLNTYFVRVANSAPSSVDSDTVTLDVIVDNTPPTFACAYQGASASQIIVAFSEVVDGDIDNFDYALTSPDGGTIPNMTAFTHPGVGATNGITLVIDLDAPMDATKAYTISLAQVPSIVDVYGNPMAFPASVPVARFPGPALVTINATHLWSYEASGTNLGTAWSATGFNDSAWLTGPALIGQESAAMAEPLRTVITPYNSGTITYYFRTHVNYSGPSGSGVLQLRPFIDDSAIVYLNGAEIYRTRMPAGPVNYLTQGVGNAVGDAAYEGPFFVCVTNLVNGDNVIAVEVHQIGGASSDLVMGLEAVTLLDVYVPVAFVTQPMNVTVAEGGSATFSVVASGTSVQYQWFGPAGLIVDATNASLTINPALRAAEGAYRVEIANLANGPISSSSATLDVIEDLTPATILWAYSTNNVLVIRFSEVTTNAADVFAHIMTGSDSSTITSIAADYVPAGPNGTTLVVTLASVPTAGLTYTVTSTDISDIYGNLNTQTVPVALYSSGLLAVNAPWKYETSGTDLGTAWSASGFDDSAWLAGPGIFDGKRGTNGVAGLDCRDTIGSIAVGTCISISNALGTAQIPSAYFRTHFTFSGNPTNAVLCFRPVLDDGAVFYLNGVEVLRAGMAAGPVAFGTTANRTVGDAGFEGPLYVCVTNLLVGTNVLAASAHQVNLTSSDFTFGSELSVLLAEAPIRVTIELIGSNVRITWPGGGTLVGSNDITQPLASWTAVLGATSPHVTPAAGAFQFYAIRIP